MSKQAREICMRCPKCGEFEVPVDWSKCARKEVQNVRCNKCGTEFAYCSAHRGRIVISRRKRKNREARLRHKIYWQARDIEWLSETNKLLRKTRTRLSSLLVLADILHDCEVGNFNASGTYGHDVEGS